MTESLLPGLFAGIIPNTPYAVPPGPHRVLTSVSNFSYSSTVGGSYTALTGPNTEPGVLLDGGFIKNTAAGTRFLVCKKITRLDTYAAKVAQANPLAYWRLNEKSGSTLFDLIGTSNLAKGSTVTLGVTGPLGDGNTGITLDGTANSVSSLVGPNTWLGASAISFEYWVNNPAWAATHEVVLCLGSVGIYTSIQSGKPFASIHTGTQYTTEAAAAISTGAWHHIAAAWESGDLMHLYVDGIEVTTNNATPRTGTLSSSPNYYLGAFNGSSLFYSGSIDDVALYLRKLTASEIKQHYSARNVR